MSLVMPKSSHTKTKSTRKVLTTLKKDAGLCSLCLILNRAVSETLITDRKISVTPLHMDHFHLTKTPPPHLAPSPTAPSHLPAFLYLLFWQWSPRPPCSFWLPGPCGRTCWRWGRPCRLRSVRPSEASSSEGGGTDSTTVAGDRRRTEWVLRSSSS